MWDNAAGLFTCGICPWQASKRTLSSSSSGSSYSDGRRIGRADVGFIPSYVQETRAPKPACAQTL
eukprot:CAMPEP_0206624022 /NCGR_PEP_ID=MMETSP0325_2-20121206/63827_1 /ASSEMBLY_ACC=CAM_ASM_000347 /TAXON_ID=2866 /ORGANISM="Crypthecodinium cohnii, Strain Seligo" /LENGTH=64 /DNA_ID=CAMNT_0054147805 /DNA_START=283 /DNA_END=477 /DNA_ORIENTATION=+